MSKAGLFRSVLALGVVALIMQVSLPRAQAYDLSSLNGSYADSFAGFAPPNSQANSYGPVYEAGLWTFDGAGSFTGRLVFNFGGGAILNASWNQNLTGTYTVNANGTGIMNLAGDHRRHFVIGAGGNELKYVGTDPTSGIVAGGSMVKQ
jgi:hypothetical protein